MCPQQWARELDNKAERNELVHMYVNSETYGKLVQMTIAQIFEFI